MLNISSEAVVLMLRLLVESSQAELPQVADNAELPKLEAGTRCEQKDLDGQFFIHAKQSVNLPAALQASRGKGEDVLVYLSTEGKYHVVVGPYPSYKRAFTGLTSDWGRSHLPRKSYITQLKAQRVLQTYCVASAVS